MIKPRPITPLGATPVRANNEALTQYGCTSAASKRIQENDNDAKMQEATNKSLQTLKLTPRQKLKLILHNVIYRNQN